LLTNYFGLVGAGAGGGEGTICPVAGLGGNGTTCPFPNAMGCGGAGTIAPRLVILPIDFDLSDISYGRLCEAKKTIKITPSINKAPAQKFKTFVIQLNFPPAISKYIARSSVC
jgi:hypothetical protein